MKTKLLQAVALLAGALWLLAASGYGQVPPPPGYGGGQVPSPPGYGPVAPVAHPPQPATMVFAQATPHMPVLTSPSESIRFSEAIEKKRVEANFESLPLSEVVIWLERTFPEVNFVLPQRLMESNPAVNLRLRSSGLRDMLEAINIATDGVVEFDVRSPTLVGFRPRAESRLVASSSMSPAQPGGGATEAPRSDPAVARLMQRYGVGGGGYGVAVIEKAVDTEPLAYQVMNLRDILRVNDPKKIRETLAEAEKLTEQTLHIMTADSPGLRRPWQVKSFQYHEGSGVLVIIGHRDAINVAMDIIRNLRVRETGDGGRSAGIEKPGEPK